MSAGLYWAWAFAYCDWLRFYSPSVPSPATDQVVFMKAVKGVFYVTEAQYFWGEEMLLPTWLLLAILVVVGRIGRFDKISWSDRDLVAWRIVGWICSIITVALFAFGDQVMAIVYNGSLNLPPEPNPSRPTYVDALFAAFAIGIFLINAATSLGKTIRIHGRKDR